MTRSFSQLSGLLESDTGATGGEIWVILSETLSAPWQRLAHQLALSYRLVCWRSAPQLQSSAHACRLQSPSRTRGMGSWVPSLGVGSDAVIQRFRSSEGLRVDFSNLPGGPTRAI